MKRLFVWTLLIATLAPLSTQSQTLTSFLAGQGLAGAKLELRFRQPFVRAGCH